VARDNFKADLQGDLLHQRVSLRALTPNERAQHAT